MVLRIKKSVTKKQIVVILSTIFVFLIFLSYHAGNFLVVSHKPQKADAIVVLMGNVPERIPEAVDLYKSGYAPRLIFPDDYEENPPEELPDGSLLHNDAAKARHLSSHFNIPDSVIVIVKGPALNTQAEAEIMAIYLADHPETDTIILVSSSYHMRRALIIFRNEFASKGLEITIISIPSRYTAFDPEKWWQTTGDRRTVFYEYLKIAYNLLWDRWW
jgi:uncharacterized SAM-binding protein YcdF (DUF218 family)